MMLSRMEAGKKGGGVSSNKTKLLKDVETINKAMYLDRNSSRNSISGASSRSKSTGKSLLPDPKSRPKARLPSNFEDSSLSVYWKRRDGVLVTRPAKVSQCVAEFEEKLTYTCSVYGSRNGPHHSAKYEAKHFLLYASLINAPELDLGKHRVDLTRLLPLTLEELEEEKAQEVDY
ncbi:NT-type C2 domain [Sesbania bispinosa]|nr:NT-type C2 domain [Sesbania bispinosa]